MIVAAANGHLEITEFLIAKNADVQIPDMHGNAQFYIIFDSGLNTEKLGAFLEMPQIQTAILALSHDEKLDLLGILLKYEPEYEDITSTIAFFEELTMVTRAQAQAKLLTKTEEVERIYERTQDDMRPEEQLRTVFYNEGVEASRAWIGNKTLIGIVCFKRLDYDLLTYVTNAMMDVNPRLLIGYVDAAMLEALGMEAFSGLILPGSSDGYPRKRHNFMLLDVTLLRMPEQWRTNTQKLYQRVYNLAKEAGVPIFGICAGAQHLVLNRGGALCEKESKAGALMLINFTVPHWMSLSKQDQQRVLDTCQTFNIALHVFRAHYFSAVQSSLGPIGIELAASIDEVPMAYSVGFDVIATQFHPEDRYQGVSLNAQYDPQGYQTRLLDNFIELCLSHQHYVNAALAEGKTYADGVAAKQSHYQEILKRLHACKIKSE